MPTLLLRNGVVHTGPRPGAARATALAVRDGRIRFVGSDDAAAAYEGADEVVDLRGALVAPAFVDAHMHAVLTGYPLTQLDLRGTRSLREVLDLVAAHAEASGDDTVILGSGWEETDWPEGRGPTAAELDRAAPGKRVCLDRIECHSSVISSELAAAIPGLAGITGYHEDGRVELDARHAVTVTLAMMVGPAQRYEAARAAMAAMAANGVAAFHENAAPHLSPEYELDVVREAAADAGLLGTYYWGEAGALEAARRLGVTGLAGDLNADGALGSRTAALSAPYDDQPHNCGHPYLTPEEIAEHVVLCTREGLQAGFHCIGDAGIAAVTEGFRLAERTLGREALRAARHRLEHVEMASPEAMVMMADLGVSASMQPLFDEMWGGSVGAYAERLGDRWRGMNALGSMARAGVSLAFGSDSPVTVVRPWQAIAAACAHHEPEERISQLEAFRAHTVGGWRAGLDDEAGELVEGAPAHLAVWDCAELVGETGSELPALGEEPRLLRLLVEGRTVAREEN
ncbi:MAG TPA: amidohydrolase [Marmoricola sp.]|nr:amidohydrolase [Marmoricola sp.]